jgi:hypothetical protein
VRSSGATGDDETAQTHLGPLLLEQHLALDVLVVRAGRPAVPGAVVEHEQELVRDVLLDLDDLVVAHKVERDRGGLALGELERVRARAGGGGRRGAHGAVARGIGVGLREVVGQEVLAGGRHGPHDRAVEPRVVELARASALARPAHA